MTSESSEAKIVTVLLPCLNEEKTLPYCIEEIQRTLKDSKIEGEVLVADNGSEDHSREIALRMGARVVDVEEKGYGSALHAGIRASRTPYVIMADSDGSYNFTHIPRFLEKLKDGADLVMGNRFEGGIEPGAMPWKNKWIGNPVLSLVGRILFNSGVRDFHCGMRGVNRESYLKLGLRSTGMEYASEMVIKANLAGQKIGEVPTGLRKDLRDKAPHLRPWHDGWRHLRLMLALAPQKALKVPGWTLTILGIVSWAILLPSTVAVGGVTFDIHTLLFASILLAVGPLLLFLGTFARIYAAHTGLLPPRRSRLLNRGSAEWLTILGALCLLGGMACALVSVLDWLSGGLGELDPSYTMRWVIPSATLLQLGAQAIAMSLIVHLVQIPTSKD